MPYAESNGARIYWTEQGAGEPLLLIMGLGATHDLWNRILPALTPRFRTILFDNRGAGKSDVPPAPYSMAEMAADAAAVLDAAGVDAAHVFGISMGGMIAQEFALQRPERVRSLLLGCTACGGRESVSARREVLEALAARDTLSREEAMRMMVPFIYDPATAPERIDQDIALRLRTVSSNEGYFAQLQAVRTWGGAYARLATIAAPTLVIHGEHDELIPPENGRVIAGAIPSARLVMLRDASHIMLTDRPDDVADAVVSFLGAENV